MTRTNTRGLGLRPRSTAVATALIAIALVAIALLAAACGAGPHPSGVASLGKTKSSSAVAGGVATTLPSGASVEQHFQKALKFSECMRSNGIPNFPDPNSTGGIDIGASSGIDPQSPQFQAAQKACRKYFPDQISPRPRSLSVRRKPSSLRNACVPTCTQLPRPSVRRNGAEFVRPVAGVDPNSPKYQAATNKCNG